MEQYGITEEVRSVLAEPSEEGANFGRSYARTLLPKSAAPSSLGSSRTDLTPSWVIP